MIYAGWWLYEHISLKSFLTLSSPITIPAPEEPEPPQEDNEWGPNGEETFKLLEERRKKRKKKRHFGRLRSLVFHPTKFFVYLNGVIGS